MDIVCVDKDKIVLFPDPKDRVFDRSTNKGSVKGWVLGLNTGQTAR